VRDAAAAEAARIHQAKAVAVTAAAVAGAEGIAPANVPAAEAEAANARAAAALDAHPHSLHSVGATATFAEGIATSAWSEQQGWATSRRLHGARMSLESVSTNHPRGPRAPAMISTIIEIAPVKSQ